MLSVVIYYSKFFPTILYLNPNHWSWGVLFTAGFKSFLGGLYYAWFIMIVFEIVLFSPRSKISNGPDFLMGLICWTISSSPGISQMSLALVTFFAGSGCCSTTVWWSFIGLRVLILGIIVVVFLSTLIEVLLIHISWDYGVIWVFWSGQGWRETFWRRIINDAPSVNNPPYL